MVRRVGWKRGWSVPAWAIAFYLLPSSGCIVGQTPGKGRTLHFYEATTGAPYWLYLPEGYDDSPPKTGQEREKHPLVMTFHGMKPFDNDHSQILEWQQEADRYGFVVCAPELSVAALGSPLPLNRRDNPYLQRDEKAIIAIMNELYRTVDVDGNKVLSTSWSYGGYLAHYMANHYPERFSCVAVRQSNFNGDILDPQNVPRYRDHKVGIFYTEHDFLVCQQESQQAAEWYARNGFDLTFAIFEKKGHERTPGVAAEFFARTIPLEPKTPPVELASMQVLQAPSGLQAHPVGIAPLPTGQPAGPAPRFRKHPGDAVEVARAGDEFSRAAIRKINRSSKRVSPMQSKVHLPSNTSQPASSSRRVELHTKPVLSPRRPGPTPPRVVLHHRGPSQGPVSIRVSATIGVVPLLVSYSASVPESLDKTSSLLWMDDGVPISNGLNGQKLFRKPGAHKLEVLVTAENGKEYRATRTITVIERASTAKK